MKRLVCEMCGGTDLIKQDGVFVCQSCGCKYSVEEARKMMVEVEGTIDVSGSTVKVDTSKRLENLYILARRARDNNNVQDAAKYYYEIRLEDPNSWEAAFYGAYFTALDCKIGQIGPAARTLAESLDTIALLIIGHVPQEEKKQAYTEMLTRAQHAGKLLYNGAKNHYEDSDYSNAKSDFVDRTAECLALMMGAGKLAEDFFCDYELAEAIYADSAKTLRSHPATMNMSLLCDKELSELKSKLGETPKKTASINDNVTLHRKKKCPAVITGSSIMNLYTIGLCSDGTAVATGYNGDGQCNVSSWRDIVAISGGIDNIIGLKSDGTVVAVGNNEDGQCNVSSWCDIVEISAGKRYSIGLRSDGTVVATGANSDGGCNVSHWTEIISIAAGPAYTVGLRSDGTVVTTEFTGNSKDDYGQMNAWNWRNIVSVAAKTNTLHMAGLRSDGTVVAVGDNDYGQCNVSGWRNIVAIDIGGSRTVGLRADGTVVATGSNEAGECDVAGWRDVIAIATSSGGTFGLRSDGTVLFNGNTKRFDVSGWHDIVSIYAGGFHVVGVRSDGTVVATGQNKNGECDVHDWNLYGRTEQLKAKITVLKRERAELPEEQTKLQAELPTLKGLFSGGRRKEVEARLAAIPTRLAEIDSELARLEKELAELG